MNKNISEERINFLTETFYELRFKGKKLDQGEFAKINEPFELFFLAMNHNWDDGAALMNLVLDHENCDKGVARMMFWMAEPEYYTQFGSKEEAEYDSEIYLLCRKIIDKMERNDFKTTELDFDPDENGYDIHARYENEKWSIPDFMKRMN